MTALENQLSPGPASRPAQQTLQAVILRLQDVPATPGNLKRIRDRVYELNRELAISGAPFRVRLT